MLNTFSRWSLCLLVSSIHKSNLACHEEFFSRNWASIKNRTKQCFIFVELCRIEVSVAKRDRTFHCLTTFLIGWYKIASETNEREWNTWSYFFYNIERLHLFNQKIRHLQAAQHGWFTWELDRIDAVLYLSFSSATSASTLLSVSTLKFKNGWDVFSFFSFWFYSAIAVEVSSLTRDILESRWSSTRDGSSYSCAIFCTYSVHDA